MSGSNVVPIPKNERPRRLREGHVAPFPQKEAKDWKKIYMFTSDHGIGYAVRQLIRQGVENEVIADLIREVFPRSKIKPHTVNWYKSQMRKDGEDV